MSFEGEQIERAALAALLDAAPPELSASLGLRQLEIGSALVAIAAALPPSAIVINRAIGLGLSAPATEDDVRELVSAYRAAGVERYFVQRHPEARPPDLVDWLVAAGLRGAFARVALWTSGIQFLGLLPGAAFGGPAGVALGLIATEIIRTFALGARVIHHFPREAARSRCVS